VIVHGFLGSSRNWQTAGTDLAARFHVLAIDLRNHGRSPHAPEMTFEIMVDDLLEWMDAQDLAGARCLGTALAERSQCCWRAATRSGSSG